MPHKDGEAVVSSGAHEGLVSAYDPDQARPLLPQPFVVLVTVLTPLPRFASPLWEVPVCCERGPAKVMPKAPPYVATGQLHVACRGLPLDVNMGLLSAPHLGLISVPPPPPATPFSFSLAVCRGLSLGPRAAGVPFPSLPVF